MSTHNTLSLKEIKSLNELHVHNDKNNNNQSTILQNLNFNHKKYSNINSSNKFLADNNNYNRNNIDDNNNDFIIIKWVANIKLFARRF